VLTQLSTFDAEADTAAYDQTLSRKAGAPISGDREKPLPIDARITEHRQELHTVLSSWTLLVAEERKVSVRVQENDPLPGLCGFLRLHHEWSVTRSWADDYAGEILALGRRAWSLLHPSGNRQFPVGRCLEVDEVDGTPCPGTMYARLTPSDPNFDVAADLICNECNHMVPSTGWVKYGIRVTEAA